MMPTAERRKKEAAKKVAAGQKSGREKEESVRAPQGGLELINEHQETMHDTELSAAADDYLKAFKEHKLWGERLKHTTGALIGQMIRVKMTSLRVGHEKVIKYKHVDAKDVIVLKDYKPKAIGRRRRM